jgi:CRP/FNR family transcriptional regulator
MSALWHAFPHLDREDGFLTAELTRRPVVKWPAGTVLVRDGEDCSAAPLVLSGLLSVSKASGEQRQIQLYTLGPGECCPLTTSSLMGGDHFPAQVSVESECEAIMVPSALFVTLVGRSPSFRRLAFGQLAFRLGTVIELVDALLSRQLDQRLASYLAKSSTDVVSKTHQELADALGSSREVVSRILRDFEKRGWVESGRGSLRVLRRDLLLDL